MTNPQRFCFPVRMPEVGGGGFRFLASFKSWLRAQGFAVTESILAPFDVLFVNSWQTSPGLLLLGLLRNPHARVVHRIDGSAQDYGRGAKADLMQARVNRLVDATIFQSTYSRLSTREKFHVIRGDGPVIHNPVDTNTFRPDGKRRDLSGACRVACCAWSTNPMKGAADVYAVARRNPHVRFILIGRYPDAPVLSNLQHLGVLPTPELAVAYRSCDVFLTFARNEACPNVVLEALASGLPVLYHPSGAASEIVGECGLPVTVEGFAEALTKVMDDRATLARAAREHVEHLFVPDKVFARYLTIMVTSERASRVPGALRGLRLLVP